MISALLSVYFHIRPAGHSPSSPTHGKYTSFYLNLRLFACTTFLLFRVFVCIKRVFKIFQPGSYYKTYRSALYVLFRSLYVLYCVRKSRKTLYLLNTRHTKRTHEELPIALNVSHEKQTSCRIMLWARCVPRCTWNISIPRRVPCPSNTFSATFKRLADNNNRT